MIPLLHKMIKRLRFEVAEKEKKCKGRETERGKGRQTNRQTHRQRLRQREHIGR